MANVTLQDMTKMQLSSNDIWPWGHQNNLGWGWVSSVNIAPADLYDNFINSIMNLTWRSYRAGLLLVLVKEVEEKGFLRGHTFVEFKSSPSATFRLFKCDEPAAHTYWTLEKTGNRWLVDGWC